MDFKSMLTQLSQLSEGTKETSTGRVHKGSYGTSYQPDEKRDEYGHRVRGSKEGPDIDSDEKAAPAAKRGRGRPKKGADASGEVKKYDPSGLQSIGWIPKAGKQTAAQKKALDKLPKTKHSLKEWIQEVEDKFVAEAGVPGQQLTMKPMPGAAQLQDPASGKVVATGPADKIKALQGSVAKGEVTMTGGKEEMAEEGGDKWIQKAVKHPGAFTKKAKAAGKSVSAFAKEKAHAPGTLGKQARLAQTLKKINKEGIEEGDIPSTQGIDTRGAGLGAGRSQATLESAKPDFLDIDKDGDKRESMKKADDDKKKKKVNESMHKHSAARLMGKAHALAKEAYNCKYDDMDEARMYHEGFKEGLDECYGQMPIVGLVKENPAATVPGMADDAMDEAVNLYSPRNDGRDHLAHPDSPFALAQRAKDATDEGNAFTAGLARTPNGGKFSVGGKSFTDHSGYDSKIDEFAFEGWEKELSSLLTEGEEVTEGMTVSISKGQQGSPDSVSVTAQDGEADALLGLIKQAGLGLFGDDSGAIGANADDQVMNKPGGINVVGDHDGMMSLIKKVTGIGGDEAGAHDSHDYEDEEGHEGHDEDTCEGCGQPMEACSCDHEEQVDEVESEDQMTYEVAEDNPPDSGAAETEQEEQDTAQANASAADSGGADDEEEVQEGLNEWANDAGKKGTDTSFEQDMDFMMKVIAGGLNKPKSTGQTTVPVIAGQAARMEDPAAWAVLAGIKK